MGTASRYGRTLRANLCEIERGVFYATYSNRDANIEELTAYQIGRSADDAKQRIELSAQKLGYETIIWQDRIIAPVFATEVNTVLPATSATYAATARDATTQG